MTVDEIKIEYKWKKIDNYKTVVLFTTACPLEG